MLPTTVELYAQAANPLLAAAWLRTTPAAGQSGFAGTIRVTKMTLEGGQLTTRGLGTSNPLSCATPISFCRGTLTDLRRWFLSVAMPALPGG